MNYFLHFFSKPKWALTLAIFLAFICYGPQIVFAVPTLSLNTSTNYNFRIDGAIANGAADGIGWRETAMGDLNNNGKTDLIVSEAARDFFGTDTGSIYILFDDFFNSISTGAISSIANSSSYSLRIDGMGSEFIGGHIKIGDVNNDGYDDLITSGRSGSVSYVISGQLLSTYSGTGNTMQLSNSMNYMYKFTGLTTFSPGTMVYDINLDGYDDLIYGNGGADNNGTNSGSHYVISGIDLLGVPFGTTMSIADNTVFNLRIDGWGATSSTFVGSVLINLDSDPRREFAFSDSRYGGAMGGAIWIIDDSLIDISSKGNILQMSDANDFSVRIEGVANTFFALSSFRSYTDSDFDGDGIDDIIPNTTIASVVGINPISSTKIYPLFSSTGNVLSMSDAALPQFTTNTRQVTTVKQVDMRNTGEEEFIIGKQNVDADGTDINMTWLLPNNFAHSLTGAQSVPTVFDNNFLLKFTGTSPIQGVYPQDSLGDINQDGKIDYVLVAPRADYNGLTNSGSVFIILNYPHEIAVTNPGSSFVEQDLTISGNVVAPNSVTNINGVQYSIDSNSYSANWQSCSAVDGTFDSKDEDYTCYISDLDDGAHTVYFRSFDEAYSYTAQSEYGTVNFVIDLPNTNNPVSNPSSNSITAEDTEEESVIPLPETGSEDQETEGPGTVDTDIEREPIETQSKNLVPLISYISTASILSAILFLTTGVTGGLGAFFERIGVFVGLIIPKKRKYWGIIYDAFESKGIPFAVVRLKMNDEVLQTVVTDLDGKYGLLVDTEGEYRLGIKADGFKEHIVKINIKNVNAEVIGDVGLQRFGGQVNWFKKVLFYARKDSVIFLNSIWLAFVSFGFVYTLYLYFQTYSLVNLVILSVYFITFLINLAMIFGMKLRKIGEVKDVLTQKGVANAAVRFYSEERQMLVGLTNKEGALKVNLKKGKYMVYANKIGYEQVSGNEITINEAGFMNKNILLKPMGKTTGNDSPFA